MSLLYRSRSSCVPRYRVLLESYLSCMTNFESAPPPPNISTLKVDKISMLKDLCFHNQRSRLLARRRDGICSILPICKAVMNCAHELVQHLLAMFAALLTFSRELTPTCVLREVILQLLKARLRALKISAGGATTCHTRKPFAGSRLLL